MFNMFIFPSVNSNSLLLTDTQLALLSLALSILTLFYTFIDRFILKPKDQRKEYLAKFVKDNFSDLGLAINGKCEMNERFFSGIGNHCGKYGEIENLETRLQLGIIKNIDSELYEAIMGVLTKLNPGLIEITEERRSLLDSVKPLWAKILNPDNEDLKNHKGIHELLLASHVLQRCEKELLQRNYDSIDQAFDDEMKDSYTNFPGYDYWNNPYPEEYKQKFKDIIKHEFDIHIKKTDNIANLNKELILNKIIPKLLKKVTNP